ncbi:MAG: hypothetical protein HY659_16025 [Rhizobiales bacterium]|nr:hypothetical protein [Hyphomicrobiales bacterium]
MGVLMIKCPNRGKEFSTGIEVAPENVRKLPFVRTYTQCPHCGCIHAWMVDDARLVERASEAESLHEA